MKREYGVDILKALAMLMVVCLHVMGRGGVLETAAGWGTYAIDFGIVRCFNTFCLCAVNCFILASGYVMCGRAFKLQRIVNIWALVVFYSIGWLLIALVAFPHVEITWVSWVKACLPVGMDQYWFVTAYFALFFTTPILNHLLETLPPQKQKWMFVGGFLLFSLYPTLLARDLFELNAGYSYLWFCYLYLVGGFIQQNKNAIEIKSSKLILAFLMCCIGTLACYVITSYIGKRINYQLGASWFNYTSPGIFFEAVILFLLMRKIKVEQKALQRLISFISPLVFSIYALHSNKVFREISNWNGRFSSLADGYWTVLNVIIASLLICISCLAIDACRQQLLRLFISVKQKIVDSRTKA